MVSGHAGAFLLPLAITDEYEYDPENRYPDHDAPFGPGLFLLCNRAAHECGLRASGIRGTICRCTLGGKFYQHPECGHVGLPSLILLSCGAGLTRARSKLTRRSRFSVWQRRGARSLTPGNKGARLSKLMLMGVQSRVLLSRTVRQQAGFCHF